MNEENVPVVPRLGSVLGPATAHVETPTAAPPSNNISPAVPGVAKSLMETMSEYKYYIIGALIVSLILVAAIWYYTREDSKEQPSKKEKTGSGTSTCATSNAPSALPPQLSQAEREARRKEYQEMLHRGQAASAQTTRAGTSVTTAVTPKKKQEIVAETKQQKPEPPVAVLVSIAEIPNHEHEHDYDRDYNHSHDHDLDRNQARIEEVPSEEESLADILHGSSSSGEETQTRNPISAGTCTAITKNGQGRRCTRKAVANGKCNTHQ